MIDIGTSNQFISSNGRFIPLRNSNYPGPRHSGLENDLHFACFILLLFRLKPFNLASWFGQMPERKVENDVLMSKSPREMLTKLKAISSSHDLGGREGFLKGWADTVPRSLGLVRQFSPLLPRLSGPIFWPKCYAWVGRPYRSPRAPLNTLAGNGRSSNNLRMSEKKEKKSILVISQPLIFGSLFNCD